MGTTLSALQSNDGVEYQWIAAVEGYSSLLTNGSTSAAVTAWSGTDWSSALGGLFLDWGGMGQKMQPWDADLSVPIVRLCVMDYDGNDTFGKAAFATSGGTVTRLTTAMDADDTLFDVQRADAFAASGEVHIGTECIAYSSRDTAIDRFTVSKRGKYAPFVGTATGFGKAHQIPAFSDGVVIKPEVCTQPRIWAGRWVGIWLHRVVAGALDTKAQAQLVFAGRIASVSDDADGKTWVEVVDCRSALKDCVLMRDQWTATLADGIYLREGTEIECETTQSGVVKTANVLTVVASGASGANQINAGVVSYDTLVSKLNEWLAAEKVATRLHAFITFSLRQRSEGLRTVVKAESATTTSYKVFSQNAAMFRFLGWVVGTQRILGGTSSEEVSDEVPFRRLSLGSADGSVGLNVANERGSFFDNKTWFPAELGMTGSESGTFGVVQTDSGAMMLVKKTAGQVAPVVAFSQSAVDSIEFLKTLSGEYADFNSLRDARMDETGTATLRQVALIDGKLNKVIPWLFFSTGTSAYNHATYDVLPNQLGAGIPATIISNIPTDVAALATPQAPCRLVIEKPTPLWDVVEPELVLRAASCVWKNQGLRIITWSTPTSTTAVHNFTEANKARPADEEDNMRTVANDDDLHARNMIRIQYNRKLAGQSDTYNSTFTLADTSSMDEIGQRPVTIKASNSFAGLSGGVEAIEELAIHLASFASLWTRPLRVLTRPIDLSFFENVAPGDHCTISDDHVRDPSTGARSISGRPGLILSHRVDWGGFAPDASADKRSRAMRGEVTILIFPRNQVTTYCPTAQVDHTQANGGYDSVNSILTCKAHEHSESSESVDVSHFVASDAIKIIELDPATAASPLTWDRTVVSVSAGANTLTFSGGTLTSWDSAKKYRIISDTYTDAQATQKTKVYQSDDADGLISDLAQAYEYGFGLNQGSTWTDEAVSTQAALYSTLAYGDGAAMDTGYERDGARIFNNFVSHRSAPSIPCPLTSDAQGTTGKVRSIVLIQRINIAPGWLGGQRRKLWVRPMYRSSDGTSATLTVTLCRKRPVGTARHITSTNTPEYTFSAPSQSNTWTTTSTTLAAGTAFGFLLNNLDGDGKGWLVFECTPKMITRGTAVCRAGGLYEP